MYKYNENKKSDVVEKQKQLFALSAAARSSYKYIVALTRRCFNCAYQVRTSAGTEIGDHMPKMISETALFSVAEEIAQEYCDNRKFPRVLFIDDIVLHGVSLSSKIYAFIHAVIEEIKKKESKCGRCVSEQELKDEMLSHIDMRVMVQKNTTLLMEPKLLWRLWPLSIEEASKWHATSKAITDGLRKSRIASTSFILSACVKNGNPEFRDEYNDWKRESIEFTIEDLKNNTEKIQQKAYFLQPSGMRLRAMPSVRVYKSEGYTFFIPFVFHGEMRGEEYEHVFSVLKELMNGKGLSFFAGKMDEALKNENEYKLSYYIQMAEMLMAQMALKHFLQCSQIGDKLTNDQFDWNKIACNFETAENNHHEDWQKLCDATWSFEELKRVCDSLPPLVSEERSWAEEVGMDQALFERCCHTAYQCGIDHCRESHKAIQKQMKTDEDIAALGYEENGTIKPGTVSIGDWILKGAKYGQLSLQRIKKTLCAAMYLIDNGYMALRMDAWLSGREKLVGIRLSHTELTLSLYKDMFSKEWDEVCRMASFCKRNGFVYNVLLGEGKNVDENSDERLRREKLVGDMLTEYEELYSEIIDW